MRQLQKFEALFIANTSTPKKRASALIATRIADVLQLLDSGYSERTIALALADDLDVPSDFVLRVLRKHRKHRASPASAVHSEIDTKHQQEPATQSKAVAKERPQVPAAVHSQKPEKKSIAAQADPGSRARSHPTLPNVELPDWADWSDQMPEESDADYIFRKALEMSPESQRKFIGEHNR